MGRNLNRQDFGRHKQKSRPPKKKTGLILKFDEDARREFLTGFHKRKLERKKKSKEKLEMQIKTERKRIKLEAKAKMANMFLLQKPTPSLENLHSEEIDMGSHFVNVRELSTADLAEKNNWIGINKTNYQIKKPDCKDQNKKCNNFLESMEFRKRGKNKKNSFTNLKHDDKQKNIKGCLIKSKLELKKKKMKQRKR